MDNATTAYYYTVYYLKLKDLEVNDDYMKFTYMNTIVKFYGWKYGDPAAPFALHEYKFLDVNGKTVVDIGASIGDTPIYFALNGAKKVIGFEPFPKIFLIAKKNIEENGLQDKIIMVNAGCGYDGKVKIKPELETNAGTLLKDQKDGIEVPVYSLNTIVKKFDVEEDSILKVDCEGCEYDLFRTAATNALRRFSKIMIEYHYGYKELIKRLKDSGFRTRHTIPKRMKNGMILGYIYAWRE
ncbi:FkbM family methyltransferase [Acidianus ambivalens]|uniref:FkbM family methyltransferase n=1 Tax=Acidianus ambivalens TaxID=2283 RepID=UPI001E336092|nr:FkbM family methyltransferase [Acidianus ambivalens]